MFDLIGGGSKKPPPPPRPGGQPATINYLLRQHCHTKDQAVTQGHCNCNTVLYNVTQVTFTHELQAHQITALKYNKCVSNAFIYHNCNNKMMLICFRPFNLTEAIMQLMSIICIITVTQKQLLCVIFLSVYSYFSILFMIC